MKQSSPLTGSGLQRRREVLRGLMLAVAATALPRICTTNGWSAEPATPATEAPPPLQSVPLVGKLTLISGAGGNIAVLGGEDGALVIDSGLASVAAETASEISKAVAGPLSLLVNTHWHFDHAGGNERLARAGARIVAHENCRTRLSTDQYNEFLDRKMPASPRVAWPVVTFSGESQIHINDEDVRLAAVDPAHTDGDILVHLDKANVLHAGDIFFHGLYPFIDFSSGGWIGGMVAAAKKALSLTDEATRIIPGHGPMAKQADLKKYIDFLETIYERLVMMKAQGKTPDEVVAAAPSKEYDAALGNGFLKPEQFVRCAYLGLLEHR